MTAAARATSATRPLVRLFHTVSVFLVAYGSLYPFHFARPDSDAEAWHAFITNTSLWTSAGDVVGNVLLCIPLGLFACAARADWPQRKAIPLALLVFDAAWVFGLQAAQIYFPPRDASLSDAFWDTVGLLLGALLSVPFAGLAAPARRARSGDATVPVCLLGAWLATQLAPFVPSLDWQLVKDALKPLLLSPRWDAVAFVFTATHVLAAGLLLDEIFPAARDRPRRFAILLAAVLVAKLFIVGQRLTPHNVLGFAAGYGAWRTVRRQRPTNAGAWAMATMLVAYTLDALSPFEWRAVPEPMQMLPFAALLEGAMEVNAWSLTEAGFVFGALLWMGRRSGGSMLGLTIALAAWVGLMEWLQRWIVGRTSDITMPLLVLALGYVLRRREPPRPLRTGPVALSSVRRPD